MKVISLQPRLPSAYQEVEYLESSGEEYINTEVQATTSTGMDIDFAYTEISANANAGVSGIYQGTDPRTDTFFISTVSGRTNSYIELFHRGITYNTNVMAQALTKYNVKFNWLNNGKANFNDSKITNVGSNQVIAKDIIIFGRLNNANDTYAFSKIRCYGVRFSEGSAVTMNLVPCYRKADNVAGMYDLVGNEFYTNAGTGEFEVGNNVNNGIVKTYKIASSQQEYSVIDRRFDGVVDLGSLRWDYASGGKFFFASTSSFIAKPKGADADQVANVYCSLYEPVSKSTCENPNTTQKCISITNSTTTNPNRLSIKNEDYTVASEFKSAMSGVILWYQTDTQTEIIR